ncbi:MAG: lycopene cyclase family protein [Actinomycetota bacterium]
MASDGAHAAHAAHDSRGAAQRVHDIAIIGGGPAGFALARSLVDRDVDVVVVAPDAPWHATYGAWRDDVADCELGTMLDALVRGAWPTVRVVGTKEHLLPRAYVVFDNGRLCAALARGVQRRIDVVESVTHSVDLSTLRLASGNEVQARLVVDASGVGAFLARPESNVRARAGAHAGAQTAYGLVLPADHPAVANAGVRDQVFTLMDWSTPPTFLYAARFGDGRSLIEETSLYAEPPHAIDELRSRLTTRLGSDATTDAESVERVNIPMGAALPARTTRVVGFGAAAGFIHPVTGYSVAASLRAAPRVAEAICTGLRRGQRGGDLADVAWRAVWPTPFVRTRAWHDMGLAVLRSLPSESIPKFVDAFFDLPQSVFTAYLRIDSQPRQVRAAMLGVFRRVDSSTRLRLMSSPGALLRALAAR